MKAGKTHVAKEGAEQVKLIQWLRYQHPKLLWSFDLAGTTDLIAGYAADFRPNGFKMPDFQLMLPSVEKSGGVYCGLYLELKRTDFKLYIRSGDMIKNEHIRTQAQSLLNLRKNGYYADFASGFEDAKNKIEFYLKADIENLKSISILHHD